MLDRTLFIGVAIALTVSSGLAGSLDQVNLSDSCVGQKEEQVDSNPDFYKEGYQERDIVQRITGEMTESRKMGIGVLLVLITSIIYAGFH